MARARQRIAGVASALVLMMGLTAGPAAASEWEQAGFYNGVGPCSAAGSNGVAQGSWIQYVCVPTQIRWIYQLWVKRT
jgi:hypothetical protein